MKNFVLLFMLVCSYDAFAMSRKASVATPTPIAASPTPASPLAPGQISISCTNCTTAESAAVPVILAKYQEIRATQCFSDYFTGQKTILENQGLTAAQIVAKLRNTPTKTTLSFYWVLFSSACGKDLADGSVMWKTACFNAYNTCQRASFMGHEFSHGMGFTHNTAGNQAAGNQQTVPYLIDEAFTACCK